MHAILDPLKEVLVGGWAGRASLSEPSFTRPKLGSNYERFSENVTREIATHTNREETEQTPGDRGAGRRPREGPDAADVLPDPLRPLAAGAACGIMPGAMDNPWVIFGFLSIFHIIGAAVLANALRELWRDVRARDPRGCRPAFLIIWALMFGCLPFAFGAGFAATETGTPLVLIGQALVWASVFLVTLLARDIVKQILEPFLHQEMLLMLFGGVFLVVGVTVAAWLVKEQEPAGFLMGAPFALVGAAIFGFGLWKLLRSTR